MPLAKMEPARAHKETDSSTAYPVVNLERGIGWQVAAEVFVTRQELADGLLACLDALREAQVAAAGRP